MSQQDTDLKSIRLPRDEDGLPVAVLYGKVGNTGRGDFKAVAVDPATGAILVDALGSSSGASPTPVFTVMHADIGPGDVETVIPMTQDPRGYDATGFNKLLIDVVIKTVGGYCAFQPMTWNNELVMYIPGPALPRVTSTMRFELDIHSPQNVYLMPTEASGTVTIAVAGWRR